MMYRCSAAALILWCAAAAADRPLVVGSKTFTESVILGEVLSGRLEAAGIPTRHRRELGGTQVLWHALQTGDVDVYPDYTGTLLQEVLAADARLKESGNLAEALARRGLVLGGALGFNNTYALGTTRERAEALKLASISDLRAHPDLRLGFSSEFMAREDGWPSLRAHYGLPHDARGLDHELAYRGLLEGSLDVVDFYSTDAQIRAFDLSVLADDRRFFADYHAVFIYRRDAAERYPGLVDALAALTGRISDADMTAMNAAVQLDRRAEREVAREFLSERLGGAATVRQGAAPLADTLWHLTREHLGLVGVSLSAAVVCALPLGVAAVRRPRLGQAILSGVGLLQTIPSLALLVLMIPLLGIGAPPAIAALFLYSLLPIVRNTHAGIQAIPQHLRDSADALGLPPRARLWRVELPLALPTILAGIKTSAVINVGTATLGALIGAGGYGQPILTGIRLNDMGLILQGALPAAGLALLVQGLFEGVERVLVPRGLRL